ncbi:MAG: hypothetical protein QXL17_04250 [Candidatus Thermoplasmatota archaeon]
MKANQFVKNQEADVLGLPMYLIIVMIVAVAVIAAVIYMIPQGKKTIIATVDPNDALLSSTAFTWDSANNYWKTTTATVIDVLVTTNDDSRKPIANANVIMTGGGTVQNGRTDSTGKATLTFPAGAIIVQANVRESYLKLSVNAQGFENYEDAQAVLLYTG